MLVMDLLKNMGTPLEEYEVMHISHVGTFNSHDVHRGMFLIDNRPKYLL